MGETIHPELEIAATRIPQGPELSRRQQASFRLERELNRLLATPPHAALGDGTDRKFSPLERKNWALHQILQWANRQGSEQLEITLSDAQIGLIDAWSHGIQAALPQHGAPSGFSEQASPFPARNLQRPAEWPHRPPAPQDGELSAAIELMATLLRRLDDRLSAIELSQFGAQLEQTVASLREIVGGSTFAATQLAAAADRLSDAAGALQDVARHKRDIGAPSPPTAKRSGVR